MGAAGEAACCEYEMMDGLFEVLLKERDRAAARGRDTAVPS